MIARYYFCSRAGRYIVLLLFVALLTALFAAGAQAQGWPSPPTGVTLVLDQGALKIEFNASTSYNRYEVQARVWHPGDDDISAWRVTYLTTVSINFGSTITAPVIDAADYSTKAAYEARVRVWHSNDASRRSIWVYASHGGPARPTYGQILDGRLNTHRSFPVVVFWQGERLSFYAIDDNSVGWPLGATASVPALLESEAAAGTLARWRNPISGKPVIVIYNGAGLITVGTFYADTPYDTNKPVIYTIDRDGNIEVRSW